MEDIRVWMESGLDKVVESMADWWIGHIDQYLKSLVDDRFKFENRMVPDYTDRFISWIGENVGTGQYHLGGFFDQVHLAMVRKLKSQGVRE